MRAIFDNSGNIVGKADYSAFGEQTILTGVLDRFAFTSQEYDPALGLYYYNARIYSATAGRFFSEDPASFSAGDTNLSRYVGNYATGATDPSGKTAYAWDSGTADDFIDLLAGKDSDLDAYLGKLPEFMRVTATKKEMPNGRWQIEVDKPDLKMAERAFNVKRDSSSWMYLVIVDDKIEAGPTHITSSAS